MVGLVTLVRGSHIEPVAQGTFGKLQFVREFTDLIEQREQAGGFDDDIMRQFHKGAQLFLFARRAVDSIEIGYVDPQ